MKYFKKIIAIILAAVLLFSTAAAATIDENGENVLISITTDKTNYSALDTAKVTVKVENKSDKTLNDVVVAASTDNWLLAKGSASNVLEVGNLGANEKKLCHLIVLLIDAQTDWDSSARYYYISSRFSINHLLLNP